MARVVTTGAEVDGVNNITPDRTGLYGSSGSLSRDTTTFRSGVASFKFDSLGTNGAIGVKPARWTTGASTDSLNPIASSTYYCRVYMCFGTTPGGTVRVIDCGSTATTNGVGVRITAAGKVQFFNNVAGTQIGSDSAATIAFDGATWYRFEIQITTNATPQITSCELRLDGTTVASTSGLTVAAGTVFAFGWIAAPGANQVCYADDVAVNDSTGANNNTWPGDGKVVLLKPISDSAVGSGWTDDAASGTNIWDAVANTPPQGIADTTGSTGLHQIRNASSNSASYDANLTSYTTAGVGASDTVNVVEPFVVVGSPVATGGKSGSFGIPSNPTIANRAFTGGTSTSTFFWNGSAAGTYLSGWRYEVGTITETPTVTLGTSPVARLTITGGTASRIAMSCFMGMYVDYTPAVVSTYQPRYGFVNAGATAVL